MPHSLKRLHGREHDRPLFAAPPALCSPSSTAPLNSWLLPYDTTAGPALGGDSQIKGGDWAPGMRCRLSRGEKELPQFEHHQHCTPDVNLLNAGVGHNRRASGCMEGGVGHNRRASGCMEGGVGHNRRASGCMEGVLQA